MADKQPVPRDTERFRFQFTNERAKLPEGFRAPMCMLTTRQLIARRLEELGLVERSSQQRVNE